MIKILASIWKLITTLKHATGNLLFLALVIFIVVSLMSGEVITVPESAALVLDPEGEIVEQKQLVGPLEKLSRNEQEFASETLLKDVLDTIGAAAQDDRIKLMVLDLSKFKGAGLSKLSEIGRALSGFKASGKPVYAFASSYDQSQYYLAAHADHIYLDTTQFGAFSAVYFRGFGVYPTYFKEALDTLKVKVHVFKVGQYKSAVEPYTRNDMSAEAQANTLEWLEKLWAGYREDITRLRGVTAEAFDDSIANWDSHLRTAGGDFALLAETGGFIDKRLSETEFDEEIASLVGKTDNSYSKIGLNTYLSVLRTGELLNPEKADQIAVIVAKGDILDGSQPPGTIGATNLVALISQAREDKAVKALVLRVDSPGGSATASEKIRYELEKTQQAGKPVVVSMSSYAASGGYWISATADRIFAAANTITGSIGIFAIIPTFEDSANALGIYSNGVGTTPLSSALNPMQSLNPILGNVLQQSIEFGYEKFTSLVAKGRHLTSEQVEALAQGRVWTGASALEVGLVDELGGLNESIAAAAELASIDDFSTVYLEEPLSARDMILRELMDNGLHIMARLTPQAAYPLFNQVNRGIRELARMNDPRGIYSQCLNCQVF